MLVGILPAAGCSAAADSPTPPSQLSAIVNTQYAPTLQALLDGAQKSLSIVQFEFNADAADDAIAEQLSAAQKRGVAVRVLLEDSVDDNRARVNTLREAGIDARLDSAARYTHAKLVVADSAQALFGSTNWSFVSMGKNNEANVLVKDVQIASWFEAYAQQLMTNPEQNPAHAPLMTPLGAPLQDGDYFARAGGLIDGAKQRIWLVVYAMNADLSFPNSDVQQLIEKLHAAKQRGVDVKVVLDIQMPDLGVNAMNKESAMLLQKDGIEVRFDSPAQVTHTKVLLVDDQAIVGSNNWGYGPFHTYHEVGMQTALPDAVSSLVGYFTDLWSRGRAP